MSTKTPKIPILVTLSSIPVIMVLGNSMLIPVLPTIAETLSLTSFQVSLLITLFSIPAAIVIPLAGILSDRIGRIKVLTSGLILYGIGGLFAGFTPYLDHSYMFLLLARVLQGIGAAGTAPIAMVLVGDLYQSENRSKALGIIESSNAMGKVLSPIFGSLLSLITWYAMFFVFPFLIIPILFAQWKLIKEPAEKKDPQPLSIYKEHIIRIFQKEGKWLTSSFSIGFITMFTMFGILFYLSDFLEISYKINGIRKGLLLAIPLLGLCLTAYLTGIYIKKRKEKTRVAILLGIALFMGVVISIPYLNNTILLIGASFISGVSSGLILPCLNLLVTSAVGLEERGIITSLYSSVRFFGVAAGPPIFGILQEKTFLLFLGTGGLLAANLILAYYCVHPPSKKEKTSSHSS